MDPSILIFILLRNKDLYEREVVQKATNPQNDKNSYFAKNYQPIEQLLHDTTIKTTKP